MVRARLHGAWNEMLSRACRRGRQDSNVEASLAFRLRTRIGASGIPDAGLGVFALDPAERGAFLGVDFLHETGLLSAAEFAALPEESRRFGWRHIENLYFRGNPAGKRTPTELMNHSFDPNVLCHLGHYFASRDIRVGEELTFDYTTFFDPRWPPFVDTATGREVRGLDWRQALVDTSRKLIEALESGAADTEKSAPEGPAWGAAGAGRR